MPVRGPFVRLLRWSGVLGAGVLALVGGLGLRGPGLVAVGVAALLAAGTAAGITRDDPGHDRRAVLESAVQAAAWTAGILLTLAGVAAVAGGLVAVLVGAGAAIAWLLTRIPWSGRPTGRSSPAPAAPSWPTGVEVLVLPVPVEEEARPRVGDAASSSVSVLTTPALGREWMRTTVALGRRLSPAERQALVRRREETLDELERRDPAGFARWLADGPAPGSDPAAYVRGRPVQGDPAAGTDAA
ncbi:hypothetical protein [Blastococcus deserti]|uniref:Uncharacterized protein n=1 Tax=Blastococcus deserti TaxID=2259033 RepID=A0ABW4X8I0_9ACTN